ncbi:MAG: hypothetical protein HY685_04410 [Chloroflexi bacterium]|nr:hypothetical protein [Chloroflexota bacterium]
MMNVAGANRRNLLKRAALLLGAIGAATAFKGTSAEASAVGPTKAPLKTGLRLYGRHWHISSPNLRNGALPARGEQVAMYGELLDERRATKLGEFYSSGLSLQAPFGPTPFAASIMEVHTFNLVDGTILGMGSRAAKAGEDTYTVVGGSGRYAGARGVYTATQRPQELGGDGTAEFTFQLTL